MEDYKQNIPSPISIEYITCKDADKNYYVPKHKIKYHQWFYVLSGSIEHRIGNKKYFLKANDSLLIPPKQIRSPRAYKTAPSYLCCIFTLDNIDLSELYLKIINISKDLIPAVLALTGELKQPLPENSLNYQHSLLFYILLGLLKKNNSKQTISKADKLNNAEIITNKIMAYMHANLHHPVTREDFSNLVNLSVSQTARIFKSVTSKSLKDTLIELRINRAKFLLTTSTLPITQISYEVGVNSFSHFTQTFKSNIGFSPSAYRKKTQQID
ncbi:MAG: cupin domain-containing protein [Planctomycetota bacterium]|jgi:AraC-like DNA-binding protein